jgi:DNA-binding MarR family transcriptional regulator
MDEQSNDPETARASALAGELRVLLSRLTRRLREQSQPGDISWPQKSVILRLGREGPATVTALARAEGVRPQSMGATIDTLEAAGLVSGAPDPTDGRQTILTLTAACQELISARRAAKEDWLFRAIQTKLTPQEQDELASATRLIQRLTGEEA